VTLDASGVLAQACDQSGIAMKKPSPGTPVPDKPAPVTRRAVLRGARALGAAALAPGAFLGCDSSNGGPGELGPFAHGVASGDPLPDAVMLWTRVAGASEVAWEIATDPALSQIVNSGSAPTSPERDFTVKVDVRGLEPGRTYYYRFRVPAGESRVARTRTAPAGPVPRARFGVAACSSYAQGYFHAYRALAERADLDAVIHLGDYIYESGVGQYGSARMHDPPREALSLTDYRARHAQYKRDPHLQEAHRQHPFITVWDDHESANNSWKDGAENHQPMTEGAWADRKAAAQRAYAEWMPIREQPEPGRIWRSLAWGDLADLIMLDTRLWARTESNPMILGAPPAEEPGRTLLGDDQATWLEERIRGSRARWKLIGQQVMVANLIVAKGLIVNLDQWHGYPASRRRLLEFLRATNARDVVVLTGDIHSSWANELVIDPSDPAQYDPATGHGALAVEMVTPGITSPGLPPAYLGAVNDARPFNPHVRWFDLMRQGYMVLDVTPERAQAAWFLYADITKPAGAEETFATAWSVASGTPRLQQDAAAAAPFADRPAPAP
jgi:alkaline phosphatase D